MRFLPLTDADRHAMLGAVGVGSIDDLYADVPKSARRDRINGLPNHAGELAVERELTALAAQNVTAGAVPSFLGAGAYRHHVPAAVDALIQRGEFLTAYTPYQPEISQGTLQALFEFQTQVALLTGMDVANASMYDGSTACAEAVLMAARVTRRQKAVLSGGLHPHYADVVQTLARFTELEVITREPFAPDVVVKGEEPLAAVVDGDTACVVVQYPDLFGVVRDVTALAEACHKAGALLVVAVTEAVAFGALRAPGDMGADIVVAEGQSFGVGLNFGGPYVGLFASRTRFVRQMPGRLVGETVDAQGRRGWVLTLSAREQHIRREKATSNICTNSGLCSLAVTIHLALLGERGLVDLARLNHATACRLADRLATINGVEVLNRSFFNEFSIRLPANAADVVDALADRRVLAGVPLSRLYPDHGAFADLLLVAATETNSDEDIDAYVTALAAALS